MPLVVKTKKEVHCVEYREHVNTQGERFGDVQAKFYVTPIPPSEFNQMVRNHKFFTWDSPTRRGRRERYEDYDWMAITYDRIDKTIDDWEGVVDGDGNTLECIKENKILVFENNPEIVNYVLDQAEAIAGEQEKEKEEEAKNLKSSRSIRQKREPSAARTAENNTES